jgi:hypothetical protein
LASSVLAERAGSRAINAKRILYTAISVLLLTSPLHSDEGYVAKLQQLVGTPYAKLDCSGYISTAHGHERCSAADMWNTCGSELKLVEHVADKDEIDYSKVRPGDVAAFHGVHVAAYLGDGVWVDSDPMHNGVGRIRLGNTNPYDPWFSGEVKILRWR